MKTKKMEVKPIHKKFRDDVIALLRLYGDKLSAEEILALTSHLVGQILALQDQRTMTREMALKIVGDNIETGNAEAMKEVLDSKGSA